jgi:26S proteasome regulatory subunit N9
MSVGIRPIDYLEGLQATEPDLASDIAELASFYQRKLWHQLTVKIESCFNSAGFNKGSLPVSLFQSFISDFAHKINLLRLAHFAVHASKYCSNPASSIELLSATKVKLEEMKVAHRAAEPTLFLNMHIAQYKIETGALPEAKVFVEAGKETLERISDVDPSVSAAVHFVASLYYKGISNYAEFYRSTLMYLSFVSSDSLPEDFKVRMAVDVSLAALLGEGIYSFGQLLQHPIAAALDNGPHQWLHDMLKVFNEGNLHEYDELCTRHAAQLNAQPALVSHERRLREKITLMCLVEMVSSLPAEERKISLADVGSRTKLDSDGVEFLLMKALSLHLVEGSLDQVEGSVHISWVQPRILTKPQIQGLKDRLDVWISKVASAAVTLENESGGVVTV